MKKPHENKTIKKKGNKTMPEKPLAVRMRPETIDDIAGQHHILYQNSLLRNMIAQDTLSSIILYGPPGTGKTSIAHVIANATGADFHTLNAVSSGKKEIEQVCKKALENTEKDRRTVLFVDEIHRFNKLQQDYLLPFVENGTVILIGATTENPYFEVNPALMSRSTLFELKPLQPDDIICVLNKAMSDEKKGIGNRKQQLPEKTALMIAQHAGGDVRSALQTLELASGLAGGNMEITCDHVKSVLTHVNLRYDKDGDMHYDTISAFIKSMRGSDPDASLYYLARLIESGEDPKFIARRIIICASEDVGNADPMALVVATNAGLAVERIGMPESRIILAQAATYIAMAPKSNSAVKGISLATDYVKNHPGQPIPAHLQDAHYCSAGKLGHGIGYMYPHDFPENWIPQQYLPDNMDEQFYKNSHNGYEQVQADYRNRIIREHTQ